MFWRKVNYYKKPEKSIGLNEQVYFHKTGICLKAYTKSYIILLLQQASEKLK